MDAISKETVQEFCSSMYRFGEYKRRVDERMSQVIACVLHPIGFAYLATITFGQEESIVHHGSYGLCYTAGMSDYYRWQDITDDECEFLERYHHFILMELMHRVQKKMDACGMGQTAFSKLK